MKIKQSLLSFLVLSISFTAPHAAKLCAKLNPGSGWNAGVFSVVDSADVTIATTPFIASGSEGCTSDISDGTYVIRFNGANNNAIAFGNIYGCMTSPFKFEGGGKVNVVFNKGQYPFNGNEFCSS